MPWHPLLGTLSRAPGVAQSQGLPLCDCNWRSSHLGGTPGGEQAARVECDPERSGPNLKVKNGASFVGGPPAEKKTNTRWAALPFLGKVSCIPKDTI